ncbi:MAG TPA: carboxypeptidase-like regulatory domain-containing protein, partial [Saprospiraceae bacterium]|nr:carboxypeptidase-like regulatory domain-containing protein [Saprospiraceae bacterium]
MKHLKNFILILTGALLLLSSCVQDDVEVNESTIFPGSQALVQTTLFGTVIDENDEPIQNAQIFYRSGRSAQTVNTDEFGNFLLENITNKGTSAFLQIEYAGKFDAFRRFGVLEGRYNRTVIKMQNKTIKGQVSASSGGRVSDANGAYVDLPANGIVDARGQSYSGTVDVAMAWIDPTSEDLPEMMVGDLSGIDLEGNQSALTTYGMLQVELLDPSGNELNLAEGQTAELGFPV